MVERPVERLSQLPAEHRAERLPSLQAIEAAVWDELETAVADKAHAWRVAVLATAGNAGDLHEAEAGTTSGADARCVILREVQRATRTLVFFTDARSAKVAQIALRPAGLLVLWSAALSWQLRLAVALDVATSGLAVSSRWARLKMTPAAQDYLSPLPPGSAIDHPHPAPAPERSTREHFAVVSAKVHRLDWLELHAQGHRRAVFDDAGARWVVP